jgi:hypothetical protein
MSKTDFSMLLAVGFFAAMSAARGQTPSAAPSLPAKPMAAPLARPPTAGAPTAPGPVKPAAAAGAPHPAESGAPRPGVPPGSVNLARPPVARPALVSPGPGSAAAPPAAGPKPPPELEQLRFLRGRWRCTGLQLASALYGPEHRFVATAESKAAVDGFWDQFSYEELRSKEHHGYKAQGLWGWDKNGKRLVRTAATNVGDWDTGTAPGLEGDKIVWSGEVVGSLGRTSYRHTITKKTDREWSQTLELRDATGKYVPISEVTCKR